MEVDILREQCEQCDQMDRLFVQYLAIYKNENFLID